MFNFFKGLSVLSAAFIGSVAFVYGADQEDGGTIEPSVTGIGAKFSLSDKRYIAIHRQSRNQNLGPIVHYFHKPLFILKTNEAPLTDYPDIVLSPPRRIGDKTYVELRLILTTPDFQEKARGFVIANDPELKQPGVHVSLNDIKVNVWPIIKLSVKLIEPLTGTMLGEWISPSLEAASGTIKFSVGLSDASIETFKKYASSGDIQIGLSYTFHNKRQEYAASLSTAAREINQALQQALSASNMLPNEPIFQSQANAFREQLATRLVTQISASSANLVPLVQTQLIDKYLSSQILSVNDIQQDKAMLDAVYGYLKPLLRSAEKKRTDESTTTEKHEEGVTVKLGAELKGIGVNIDQSDKDSIEAKNSVTFEYSEKDQAYEPTKIKVYKLSDLSDQQTFQVVATAFISQGGDSSFQDDSPIRTDFTEKLVDPYKNGASPANFDAVLPGMSFCFFGNQIPKGYVEVSSSNSWPDAAWVLDPLRGKPMPDSQNMLLGFTDREPEIGTAWRSGAIAIGTVVVPSDGLQLVPPNANVVFTPGATTLATATTRFGKPVSQAFTPSDTLSFFVSEGYGAPSPPNPYPVDDKNYETRKFGTALTTGSPPEIQFSSSAIVEYNKTHLGDTSIMRANPFVLRMTPLPTQVAGHAAVTMPKVALDSIDTSPQHIRCRLLVKE